MAAKSILSAGEIIRAMLMDDEAVASAVTKIYPVVIASEARLPYIVYTFQGLDQTPVKNARGADTARIEVGVYAAGYTESLALAESVRDALDGVQGEGEGLVMRSCFLTDCYAAYANDAYIHVMTFTVKIYIITV